MIRDRLYTRENESELKNTGVRNKNGIALLKALERNVGTGKSHGRKGFKLDKVSILLILLTLLIAKSLASQAVPGL